MLEGRNVSGTPQHFESIVIGGGSGGYAAARTLREVSDSVAIIDGSDRLGGLCILRGCMPSKTLIYAAEVLHHARHGEALGLRIPEAAADLPAVIRRKDAIIGEFAEYRQGQLESDRFTLFRQNARFVDADRVELEDGSQLTADRFIIATGSVVASPPVPGIDAPGVLTSDDILAMTEMPESILVLGGGVVACELTQYLSRIGSRVTQIQRSAHILKDQHPDASRTVERAFRDEGIELFTGTHLQSIERSDNGFTVYFHHGDTPVRRHAPALLNALGRRPATDRLNLAAAGIRTRQTGHIETSSYQQTSNPRVYAVGDCAGPHEIVHIAIRQGEIAARHATGRKTSPSTDDDLMSVVFTDPQVAAVGLNLADIQSMRDEVVEADYPFDDHGKSIVMGQTRGYVRCYAEKTSGKLLRAECVGRDGGELIHAMAWPVASRADVRQVATAPWYHPTLAEIWSYPLEDLAEAIDNTST